MASTVAAATAALRTPEGQKLFRYSMASVVAVIVSVVLLVFFDGVLRWDAVVSSTLATGISAVPSYILNRRWAWGKTGKSHVWREVVPFWALAFVGWAFSTYAVKVTESAMRHSTVGHLYKTALIAVVYVGAFGVLWVAKFVIFNRVLFIERDDRAPAGGAEVAG